MNIQVLISAMYQTDCSLPKKLNIETDYLLINQTSLKQYGDIVGNRCNNKIISTEERGLSKSRNLALSMATGDICLLCDDDLVYYSGYDKVVEEAYQCFPDADIILFDFDEPQGMRSRRPISDKSCKLNYFKLLRGNSVRISFKLASIKRANIKFNELFGAGSGSFTAGEDTLFLVDCYRANLKIYYYNKSILKLNEGENSTWFNGFDEQYFYNIGGFAYMFFRHFWILYVIQYLLRHRKHLKQLGFRKSLISCIKGKQFCKRKQNNFM